MTSEKCCGMAEGWNKLNIFPLATQFPSFQLCINNTKCHLHQRQTNVEFWHLEWNVLTWLKDTFLTFVSAINNLFEFTTKTPYSTLQTCRLNTLLMCWKLHFLSKNPVTYTQEGKVDFPSYLMFVNLRSNSVHSHVHISFCEKSNFQCECLQWDSIKELWYLIMKPHIT